jgi:hypothetical protein
MTLSKVPAAIRLLDRHRTARFGPNGRHPRIQHRSTAQKGPILTRAAIPAGRLLPNRLPNVIVVFIRQGSGTTATPPNRHAAHAMAPVT